MAIPRGEAERGRGGGGGRAKRYRGDPSREETPGVEDLEAGRKVRGDTAAGVTVVSGYG